MERRTAGSGCQDKLLIAEGKQPIGKDGEEQAERGRESYEREGNGGCHDKMPTGRCKTMGRHRKRERERTEQDVRWMGQEGKGQGRNTEKKCRDME